jgi:hypothetical protein
MSEEPPPTDDRNATDVAYFMIRVERGVGKYSRRVAGTVERLGTGEKQRFQDGDELLRFVAARPGGSSPDKA